MKVSSPRHRKIRPLSKAKAKSLSKDFAKTLAKMKESGNYGLDSGVADIDHHYEDAADEVNHPRHYTSHPSGIECIEIVEHFGFNIGNAVKYCWRAGLKSPDPKKDLEKGLWYIKRELERLTKEQP